MPDELPGFQTSGLSWQERAERCPGDAAVYASDDPLKSRWLGLVHEPCFSRALRLLPPGGVALDFGCGIGRTAVDLARRAGQVLAVDITPGMLVRARERLAGLPAFVGQIDGVRLPFRDASVDLVWVCGVLRYSLLVPEPRHREIVGELHRVLRPGGHVCNVEIYVDRPAAFFSADFRERGFEVLEEVPVHVHRSRFDALALGRFRTLFLRRFWARASVEWTRRRCSDDWLGKALRDYSFVYRRP